MEKQRGKLRLWTFTLSDAVPIERARELWSDIWARRLRRLGFSGVRVFELHPGGHGLHVHLVTSKYIRVENVRSALIGTAWGRIDVQPLDPGSANYVAKYLRKGERPECMKGCRLWSTVGDARAIAERVKDILCDSALSRLWWREYKAEGRTYADCLRFHRQDTFMALKEFRGVLMRITTNAQYHYARLSPLEYVNLMAGPHPRENQTCLA